MSLNFRLDSYDLTKWELTRSLFLSEYSIRHFNQGLEEKKFGHFAICVIEAIPLVGILASLIERIVVYLYDKWTIPQPNLKISTLKARVQAVQSWQNAFCDKVKKTMDDYHKRILKKADPEISLNAAQKELLHLYISNIIDKKTNQVHFLSQGNMWVFELPGLPGLVFKIQPPDEQSYFNSIEYRYRDTLKTKSIINDENLFLLHAPQQQFLRLFLNNSDSIDILVEPKYEVETSFERQRGIYDFCMHDPRTKEFITELMRQLIILAIKAGWQDVKYNNMPLLNDGTGAALIDMDCSENPIVGLISSNTKGKHGVLNYLTPELLEEFIPLLKQQLTPNQFDALHIDQIKEYITKRHQILKNYPSFLKEKGIQEPFQKIHFFTSDEKGQYLENKINRYFEECRRNLTEVHETIESDRAVFKKTSQSILDKLKRYNRILDYQFEDDDFATIYC